SQRHCFPRQFQATAERPQSRNPEALRDDAGRDMCESGVIAKTFERKNGEIDPGLQRRPVAAVPAGRDDSRKYTRMQAVGKNFWNEVVARKSGQKTIICHSDMRNGPRTRVKD